MVWFGNAVLAELISASEQLGIAKSLTTDLEPSQGRGRPASRAQATRWESM